MNSIVVSVITPVYNGEKFLERCINSVQSQTFNNWELLLVDDGSNDLSIKVIEGYLADDRIKLIRNESNIGISATRNNGIRHAKGSLIALLDQDDAWMPQKLEKQVTEYLKLDYKIGLMYTNLTVIKDGQVLTPRKKEIEPATSVEKNFNKLFIQNFISSPTVVIPRVVLDEIGLFNESIKWGGDDYELWLRIALKYRFLYLDEVLAVRYEHNTNYSSNTKQQVMYTLQLGLDFKNKYNLDKRKLKMQKSSLFYRYGLSSIKGGNFIEGVYYILKSLISDWTGFMWLMKTIKNRM